MKLYSLLLCTSAALCIGTQSLTAQITERPRPAEWDNLVEGARFIDRFLPMPAGKLSADVWGAKEVVPRYVDNGIEDNVRSYWGGNILKEKDNKYHLYVCGWPENSPKGHMFWPNSTVYHAVCDNSTGPFIIKDTIGPGHNPEAFRLKDGRVVVYVIDGYYLADDLNGPWTRKKFDFDNRDRRIIEGLSNLTFARREDGSYLMVCRGGGVWISQTGLSPYNQITDKRVYPPVKGEFEDPVVWRDHIQYHLIVNDWLGRIAFYLRSKDGVNWVTDPGEAYLPGISVHEDGKVENWFKYERIKILQDKYGRAIQANFAVIDTLKNEDLPNDNHSSKNISIPLNPGLLLTVLDAAPVTDKTKTIRVKITAEEGFNPQTDIDLASLRFGASTEVNHGRGCRVQSTKNDGKDLIITFDAKGNGITAEEFAPKLLGKTTSGKLLYGYARLPWISYNDPILSARLPVFASDSQDIHVVVENFGQVASGPAVLKLEQLQDGSRKEVGQTKLISLSPYGKTNVTLTPIIKFEKGKAYDFVLTIRTSDDVVSTFTFQTTPVE
ncbi:glycoside hydrolase family protein [Parabacteroides faecis]|uniref:glycoside hydrolase family protein n=1 Tax=Parabacteroides faecis TaxID=1217282 RepID=UPI002164E76F|nr:glycoside hydrolase family protein [Parabacteroides faecis]MCS2892655.1 glycoside hydrolase family protein [Parabacteroides faecis]UVQ48722.1 glycoside hydrolase family protein [Parabacteroides faecis]